VSTDDVLEGLVAWASERPDVRAVVLTSTRARPGAEVDAYSDYDVILGASSPAALASDDTWTHWLAEPMTRWGDESEVLGLRTYFRGVHYDEERIDYTLWPLELFDRIASPLPDMLDVGYRVLLDKDARAAHWPAPTYRAHIPPRPDAHEYRALVEEFWWGTTYVAKSLRRGDLVFARVVFELDLRLALVRALEWKIELDRDWELKPGKYGKGIERLLPPRDRDELAATYAVDVATALERTTALFRRVAREVGDALGYAYPDDVDRRTSAFLARVRQT
jgi:aminoglycoside 6-adenylyltransferase